MYYPAVSTSLLIPWFALILYNDFRYRLVPNKLTFPALIFGLLYHFFMAGATGLLFALKGAGLGLAILMPAYMLGLIGAGDCKLWLAAGSIFGAEYILGATIWAVLVNAFGALIMLFCRKELVKSFRISIAYLREIIRSVVFRIGEMPKVPDGPTLPASLFLIAGIVLQHFRG